MTEDARRWRALAVCLIGGSMVLLDVSIVNVALPSIETGLKAATSELQWVVSGYALTFGLLLVPAGRFGDLRGRREVFVGALALFTLASALCGAAPNAITLVVARLIQGLAGGTLTPQISATIQEMFSGRERGRAFGYFGTMVGIATAIGPLLGGLLIQLFGDTEGWRAVFYVNIPIGLIAIPFAWWLLPTRDDAAARRKHDYDPVGVVLLGIGAVVLLLPFVQEREWGTWKWLLLPLAAAVLAVFVLWDRRYLRREKEPLVDFALYKRRSYAFGSAMIAFYFAGFTPLFFVFTLYLQTGLAYSALAAGLAMTPFAIGSAVAANFGGRRVHDYGRPLITLGLLLVAVGFVGTIIAVHFVPNTGTGWATVAPLLVAGFGSGLVIAPNQTLTLSEVPVEQAGTAGGLLQTGQRVGAAVGIAAVGSAFFASIASSHGNFAHAYVIGILAALGFIAAAFVMTLVDIYVDRHRLHGKHELERDDDKHEAVTGTAPG
ncbi:MAG TPA: MFS transporter [Jatrophihabitantaceae bacterium]